MNIKNEAMKPIKDRFSWDSDIKVISKSIDTALEGKDKEYKKKIEEFIGIVEDSHAHKDMSRVREEAKKIFGFGGYDEN